MKLVGSAAVLAGLAFALPAMSATNPWYQAYEDKVCAKGCQDYQYFLASRDTIWDLTYGYGSPATELGQTGPMSYAAPSSEAFLYPALGSTTLWLRHGARFSVQSLKFGPIWTDFLDSPVTSNPIAERIRAGEEFSYSSPEGREYYSWLASDSTPYTGPLFEVIGYRDGNKVATTLLSLDETAWDVAGGFRFGGSREQWPGGSTSVFSGGYVTKRSTTFHLDSEFADLDQLVIFAMDGYRPLDSSFFQRNFAITGEASTDFSAKYHCSYKVDVGDYCAAQSHLLRVGVTPASGPLPQTGNSPATVPLPASLWLSALGLAALVSAGRMRRPA